MLVNFLFGLFTPLARSHGCTTKTLFITKSSKASGLNTSPDFLLICIQARQTLVSMTACLDQSSSMYYTTLLVTRQEIDTYVRNAKRKEGSQILEMDLTELFSRSRISCTPRKNLWRKMCVPGGERA